jgi:hypothetical protein
METESSAANKEQRTENKKVPMICSLFLARLTTTLIAVGNVVNQRQVHTFAMFMGLRRPFVW